VVRKGLSQIEPKSKSLWCGRHVKVVDGSSLSMPDTEENQALYPQPKAQKKGCGFPVMRITASFSLVTGHMLEHRKADLHVHERTLWHQMWGAYEENDVVLGDRGFCSFCELWALSKKKVDCVMRLFQRSPEKAKIIKQFNENDCLVEWAKPKECPKWITKEQWLEVPKTMTLRQVKVIVDIPGFRTQNVVVATTLLDNKKYPSATLSDLYRRRWLVELFLKDMKTTMRMDVLRCKTPELVHKELTIFIIAYNLIRSLIFQAALNKGIDPYRISMAGTIAIIRQWAPILATNKDIGIKKKILLAIIELVAKEILPHRKKPRSHPRAIKRRSNCKYQLLTKPRHEFKEIPHRSQYRKNA